MGEQKGVCYASASGGLCKIKMDGRQEYPYCNYLDANHFQTRYNECSLSPQYIPPNNEFKILKHDDEKIIIQRSDKSIVEIGYDYIRSTEGGKIITFDELQVIVQYKNPRHVRSMTWEDFEIMNDALYKIFGR